MLECTLRAGRVVVTVDLRLDLRQSTVRRINRRRLPEVPASGSPIPFISKPRLARQMLEELAPLLPEGWTVYVQFDSWYAAEKLIKYVRRQGWHVMCALKRNRKLNGKRLDQLSHALRHKRYTRVRVAAADGSRTTYYVRQATGRLEKVPFDVRAFISKRHPGAKSSAYFMSTDLTRTAQRALQGYSGRWSCEVVNFYLKTQLGLVDFRVRSYEAVERYLVVVQLTWAYVERRYEQERGAPVPASGSPGYSASGSPANGSPVKCYGDIIRRHRDEHAVAWLTHALQEALATGQMQPVLDKYLRLAG